ncbi:MAG: Vi polysaccharide biosynthesis UDP-N-acetylglucosamine C-6 dehydrogenase TviB, partial [Thiotrichales bacterium]|nr:Vi polysaccharide biosynthesis UDP-N-acetylglucosamine C-6 dehydrogenase TviB [Thiotrichales bacterium]
MIVNLSNVRIGIVGLGYVGLPLAVEFGKKFDVVGFDIHQARIEALKAGHDHTLEVSDEELKEAVKLTYTASLEDIRPCNVYIVTVPT